MCLLDAADCAMQAHFFGLPDLIAEASACLNASSARAQGNVILPKSPASVEFQYDSVYLETGFHPVNSTLDLLQKHQAAVMQVCVTPYIVMVELLLSKT